MILEVEQVLIHDFSLSRMVDLHHELGKFLDDAKYYLSAYPNETIVMSMKKDYDSDSKVTKTFEEIFRELL